LQDPAWRKTLRRLVPWLLWIPLAAMVCLQYRWGDLWMQMWGFTLVELATACVLLAVQRPSSQVARMLSHPSLVWLGRMSYGVYLWHYPLFVYLRARHSWDVVLLAGLPLAIGLAALSHYTIEAWAARRRGMPMPVQAAG
jgi:peptidoglycan/LPS O-acetylase OafA/YrhL